MVLIGERVGDRIAETRDVGAATGDARRNQAGAQRSATRSALEDNATTDAIEGTRTLRITSGE